MSKRRYKHQKPKAYFAPPLNWFKENRAEKRLTRSLLTPSDALLNLQHSERFSMGVMVNDEIFQTYKTLTGQEGIRQMDEFFEQAFGARVQQAPAFRECWRVDPSMFDVHDMMDLVFQQRVEIRNVTPIIRESGDLIPLRTNGNAPTIRYFIDEASRLDPFGSPIDNSIQGE